MAGRAAVFHLLPLSTGETSKVTLLRGGFPEVLARPRQAEVWFRSYVQTYLERDVRAVTSIRDLATFRRFLSLLASRCGQVLNKTDLAAPLGVTVPTIAQWIGILETTGQVLLVPPYFENFGKRLTKSPKIYFADTGLLCHLLGVSSLRELKSSPFAGPVFECFVASEIVKLQLAAGRRRELYFFRDAQGLEIDFIVPLGTARLGLIEAKASSTAVPKDAAPLGRLMSDIDRYQTEGYVVFQPGGDENPWTALAPQVRAVDLAGLLSYLGRRLA
jgi:predicted AAA+ superfamily ATPase